MTGVLVHVRDDNDEAVEARVADIATRHGGEVDQPTDKGWMVRFPSRAKAEAFHATCVRRGLGFMVDRDFEG